MGTQWSGAFYRLHGLEPRSLTPHFSTFLDQVVPEERDAFERLLGEHMLTFEPFRVRYHIVRAEGKVVPVEGKGVFHVDDRGNLDRFDLEVSRAD